MSDPSVNRVGYSSSATNSNNMKHLVILQSSESLFNSNDKARSNLAKGDITRWAVHLGLCGRKSRGGMAMVPLERAIVISYTLSIVTIALSVPFSRNCHRMFPTLKSTGVGHFGAKFMEEMVN